MTTFHERGKTLAAALVAGLALVAGTVQADIPGRVTPAGPAGGGTSGANPGTQQQELPNITFPAPYNVFEFVVTCMACHSGTVDQTAGHGANWGGSNMASAMRDPVFRANQVLVNNTVKNLLGADGAGNVCMRCHSPNGWLSGRFDPVLGGAADGSDTIQSILLSTDTEGISCEMCHRTIGASFKAKQKAPTGWQDIPGDLAFNMLAGILDWPHQGRPYPEGPGTGNPFGDATLQFHDGMGYGGKYAGSFFPYFADDPLRGTYTGQTYGYNPTTLAPFINPDGSYTFHYDRQLGPPADEQLHSVSIEHPTRDGDFVRTPEFCGSCHDLTVPVANHGMPEQRTYTEWKYSAFGPAGLGGTGTVAARCQDCHMPTKKHEYSDVAKVSLNVDPTLAGWWPYGKDRNPNGGTSFHKLVGANRDLPQMMKVLYPEVDLEVIGAPTGHDPTIFPGMLSDRGPMFDRAQRNTEISLRDAASIAIVAGPTCASGTCTVTVRVTNHTGHRIPSGYPDGRKMWISLVATNGGGAVVYESGYYNPTTARLSNTRTTTALTRAQDRSIDAASNTVMIYERGTCMTPLALDSNETGVVCDANGITPNLLNKSIAFDNRIPPAAFDYAAYRANGVKFWNYAPNAEGLLVPYEEAARYPAGQNFDEVTYAFPYAGTGTPRVRAELYWQTHTREFMDHLNKGLNAMAAADKGPRPEAPPNPLDPNYPLTPTYLSDSIALAGMTDLDGAALQDHWGGIAYAAWLQTGKGAPFLLAAADSGVAAPPAGAPTVAVNDVPDPDTGGIDPHAQEVRWSSVAGADGYLVWIRYGGDTSASEAGVTASWDKLALVPAPLTSLLHEALNPGKTFQYRVQAYNAAGYGPMSPVASGTTPAGLLIGPINTRVSATTASSVALTFFDQDFNELGFVFERQSVLPGQPLGAWVIVAYMGTPNGGATGSVGFTDSAALPACPPDVVATPPSASGCRTASWTDLVAGRTYNYRVSSYNGMQVSPPDLAVAATTLGPPLAPSSLTATLAGGGVTLAWLDNSGNETGFRVYRGANGAVPTALTTGGCTGLVANVTGCVDNTIAGSTTYQYFVVAFNAQGESLPTNTATITTAVAVAAPTTLVATPSAPGVTPQYVNLSWRDVSNNENGFYVERAPADTGAFARIGTVTSTASQSTNVTRTVSFRDTTVLPKTTYLYRVQAYRTSGGVLSAYSNVATAVTPGEVPQTPTNLRVPNSTPTTMVIRWNDVSTNEAYFSLERSPDVTPRAWGLASGAIPSSAIPANATRYDDAGLTPATRYRYRIRACNADGCSAYSNEAVGRTTRR